MDMTKSECQKKEIQDEEYGVKDRDKNIRKQQITVVVVAE